MNSEEKQKNEKNVKIIGQMFGYTTIYIDDDFVVEPTPEILEQLEESNKQIRHIKKMMVETE